MLKLTVKKSYINEILHEINDFKVQRTFVDCKLVCQGGVVQCHAAMLQYANIWWVNCRNSDIDECVIIIPMSEGSNLVEEIYSGANFENNLMDAVYDYNNNEDQEGYEDNDGNQFTGKILRQIISPHSLALLSIYVGRQADAYIRYLDSIRELYVVCVKNDLDEDYSYEEKMMNLQEAFEVVNRQYAFHSI